MRLVNHNQFLSYSPHATISEMLVPREHALRPDMDLEFVSVHPTADRDIKTEYSERVEAVAESGFRGPVAILSDSVIKTAVFPDSPKGRFKDTISVFNWNTVDFPPAVTEDYARHDAIAGSIIGLIIPSATEGRVSVANSLGYVNLGEDIGYAQHVERVSGKIATFLDDGSARRRLAADRQLVWDTCVEYGIEAGSQVHPLNPLGANMWLPDDDNPNSPSVWFDYFAKFPLKGRVFPNPIPYKFHRDAQKAFGVEAPFDKIHITRTQEAINRHRELFSEETIHELSSLLELYSDARSDHEKTPRAEYLAKNMAVVAGSTVKQTVTAVPKSIRAGIRMVYDNDFREEVVVDKLVLDGYKEAAAHGLVNDQDVTQAEKTLREHERIDTLVKLGAFFLVSSAAWNIASIPIGADAIASFDMSEIATTGGILFFGPGVMRAGVVAATSIRKDMNLWDMSLKSAVPTYGTVIALPSQVQKEIASLDPTIKHYALRGMLGKISNMCMQGGIDSDFVSKVWDKGYNTRVKVHAAKRKIGAVATPISQALQG